MPDPISLSDFKIAVLGFAHGTGLAHFTTKNRVVTQFFLDPEELVVFRNTICAAERSCLDLACVGRDGDVGDGGVFSFA